MKPSEVRRLVLEDHDLLRRLLDEIDTLAIQFEQGSEQVGGRLRTRGQRLYEKLGEHLELEDRLLVPALRAVGREGKERAERLSREHLEQGELLKYLMGRLGQGSMPTLLIARELRNFVALMRYEMIEEEDTMLGEDVLRNAGAASS